MNSSAKAKTLLPILVLLVVWLTLLVLSIQLLRERRPLWVFPVPFVAFLIWFAALSAGEAWLGWTP